MLVEGTESGNVLGVGTEGQADVEDNGWVSDLG